MNAGRGLVGLLGLLSWIGLAAGCLDYDADQDACAGIDCSGHGLCRVADDGPVCDCEAGWEPAPDMEPACVESETVIVDHVSGLVEDTEQILHVRLERHEEVLLVLEDELTRLWADMIELQYQYDKPVYLEIDPFDRSILELELPLVSPVDRLTPTDEGLEVLLQMSAAIHFLSRDHPRYQEFYDLLDAALESGESLVVTERDGQGIIDVRPDSW